MIDAHLDQPATVRRPDVGDRSMRRLEYLLALLCFVATLALSALR